jgi:hypothetical protein
MIIGVKHTISLLKSLFIELFLNKTDKVSDISDNSVVNATAFGVAKVGQKCLKDVAIVAARIFPDTASGSDLDVAAQLFGVSPRKGALGSSTYVKVIAEQGTEYKASESEFVNQNGIRFLIEQDVTVGPNGYDYVKVRSAGTGSQTNVAPNTINNITGEPVGHKSCTNEYYAIGGRDSEDDETFRIRIRNNLNILSIGTREYFTQVFQNIDDRVLMFFNFGVNENAKLQLALSTQNGIEFTETELANLLEQAAPYFPLSDRNKYGDTVEIVLTNVNWYIVGGTRGVEFMVDIDPNYDPDEVRLQIQIGMTKYLDFRYWTPGGKVEWDDLLGIVKNTAGVRYVQDSTFYPHTDEIVPVNALPRIRRFSMRDLKGNDIFSNGDDDTIPLSPIFYPSDYAGD